MVIEAELRRDLQIQLFFIFYSCWEPQSGHKKLLLVLGAATVTKGPSVVTLGFKDKTDCIAICMP